MSQDAARTFFPDVQEIPSLYSVLSVSPTATPDELKRAYRRLSLLSHPDKHSASGLTPEQATLKFQQIGFAYSVLKDDKRRDKYDRTGSTEESSGDGAKTEAEWRDYFKELWSGEVTADSIEKFKQKYQGSEEELQDLYDSYNSSSGDLESILSSIMCSTHSDESRFVSLLNDAIKSGKLVETKQWTKTSRDVKGKKERKRKADDEEKEAEKLAKELGVHDKLYGKGNGTGKGKAKATTEGDDEGDAALKALIMGNRDKRMNSLMDSLEAKYGAKKRTSTGGGGGGANGAKKQKKGQKVTEEEGDEEQEDNGPTEEEFARIQAEMDARRAAKTSSSSNSASSSKSRSKSGGRKSK